MGNFIIKLKMISFNHQLEKKNRTKYIYQYDFSTRFFFEGRLKTL
jgi:hypothetical protein